ncbi:MAG TPA: M48 family metalloprotease [Burkholderiales bacterium]
MDFFAQQDEARRRSRWLVAWYAAALLFAVASYCLAAALGYYALARFTGALPLPVPLELYLWVGGTVGGFILAVSAYRMWQLGDGGPAVAELLGARYVEPGRCTPAERRLVNVVEEMSIASGIAVPPVYLLDHDDAINALVAGFSPHEAVIVVTRGAAQKLSRDELQGLMGHEFSHILNGDMALNVRLVGLLAGLTWMADYAERVIYEAAWLNRGLAREERGGAVLPALLAGLIALVGFPGTFAADFIKAAISRQREMLADSASIQFTRNPDGIAGALDSILALRANTMVRALHGELFSHMFFAPAVLRWWSWPTHPPILERIARVHPRFRRDEYRERRHGTRTEVAVLDGSGSVVKNLKLGAAPQLLASVGRPAAEHVDHAKRLLERLPSRLREALHRADEAELAMFALAATGEAELAVIEAKRPGVRAKLLDLQVYVGGLKREHMLALAELAVPAIKEQRQSVRDAFVADLGALMEADRRMTLREFVLLTLLRQRLREGAGQPIRTQFRRIEEVAADAHVVVSLVALAAEQGSEAAFRNGAAVLDFGWQAPLAREQLSTATVGQSLERLRHLSPFAKPAILKACVETAAADGSFRLAEAELVRMVAATLDCPVPPVLAAA